MQAVTEHNPKSSKSAHMQKNANCDVLLRVFAYKKGSLFFACCLDLNLVSQGKSLEEALGNLRETVVFYLKSEFAEGKTFEEIRRPAPFYFRMRFLYIFVRALMSFFQKRVSDHYRIISARLCGEELFPFQYLTV